MARNKLIDDVYGKVVTSLSQYEIYENGDCPPCSPVVYFIIAEYRSAYSRLVFPFVRYVGKTVNIKRRWSNHHLRDLSEDKGWVVRYKEHDSATFATVEEEEAFYIMTLRPPYNQLVKVRLHQNGTQKRR